MSDSQQRRLAAILAADIAGYSALMGSDEEATVRALKGHQSVVLPMIGTHGGRIIDTAGDGILAEFASVVNAVNCAVAIQKVMAERNAAIDPARRMQFRIGVNLGDVIFDDARIYGDGINIAARLEAIADPGGICISDKVNREVRGKIDVSVRDLGLHTLKNISEHVRVYRIDAGVSPIAAPTPSKNTQRNPSLPDKPSIAILPFANMSGDSDQEFFADGIAEDLLTVLSKHRWLFVIARTSSFTYRGKSTDIKLVGRELGVRYVLEGGVRRSGNRVRITGQLIDATTGAHVWAEKFDRDIADLFAVQDEITQAVAGAIAPAIVSAEQNRVIRKPPDSLDAWEAYQRGVWHMSKHEAGEIAIARSFFLQAIDIDPNLASAHSWLAQNYCMAGSVFGSMELTTAVHHAEPHARRAILLDNEDADARARLAIVLWLKGDAMGAVLEAEQALLIDPYCPEAHGLRGVGLVGLGRPVEGRESLMRCIEISPKSAMAPVRLSQIAEAYYIERDYENAILTAQRVIRQNPNSPQAYRWLAAGLAQVGRQSEASAAWRELVDANPASLDIMVRRRLPGRRPEDHQHMLEGLRKAGWQE
ncbi:MAG: adenylate/guanylate cyclase domain-containing protein [Hyphomicrobium sp.]